MSILKAVNTQAKDTPIGPVGSYFDHPPCPHTRPIFFLSITALEHKVQLSLLATEGLVLTYSSPSRRWHGLQVEFFLNSSSLHAKRVQIPSVSSTRALVPVQTLRVLDVPFGRCLWHSTGSFSLVHSLIRVTALMFLPAMQAGVATRARDHPIRLLRSETISSHQHPPSAFGVGLIPGTPGSVLSSVFREGLMPTVAGNHGDLSAPWRWTWEHPVPERLRTNAFLFSVICLYSMLNVIFSPLSKKRELSAMALAIHACGCISYFLMGNHWWPVVVTPSGWPLLTARVVEWSISVPLFVYMLAQLIDPRTKNIRREQAKQSVAIIIGGIGPLLRPMLSWTAFTVSTLLQIAVLMTMHNYLRQMERSVGRQRDRAMLVFVHVATMVLFMLYPVIWCLGTMCQRITVETETTFFSWIDLGTKFMFTSVLCNLTTRAYDFDLVDYGEHFWRFVKVLEVPVFALSADNRIVYWNSRMEDITELESATVRDVRLSQLAGVFSAETRKSLLMLAEQSSNKRLEGRYEVPILVGGGHMRKVTFSVLHNPIKEADIPATVFVGAPTDPQDSSAFVQLAYYIHNYGNTLNHTTGPSVPPQNGLEGLSPSPRIFEEKDE